MSEIFANLRKFKAIAAGALAMTLAVTTPAVSAAPVIGAPLFWSGGDVTLTVEGGDAGYTSEFTLFFSGRDVFIATNRDARKRITILAAGIDEHLDIWDELPFGIRIQETSEKFLSGQGSNNPDGLSHAAIDALTGGVLRVGFEDLYGGGDLDYNDNIVILESGVVTAIPRLTALAIFDDIVVPAVVPEPATLALFGLGLAGLAATRRRRR